MSVNSRSKTHTVLLILVIFILYCIYAITGNLPTSSPLLQHTTQYEKTVISDASDQIKSDICKSDTVNRNTDPNHTNAHLEFWQRLPDATVQIYKRRWQRFVAGIKHLPVPRFKKDRGIVLVAGNGDTFQRTLTTINLLRKVYKSILDIEVWHLSDEQPSEEVKAELARLNATPRDMSNPKLVRPIIHRRDAEKQFQIKAAAVINSDFRQVIYLDSDNIPTKDPAFLFDTPEYNSTGALFWPDFWKTHGDNKIFDVLDIPCDDEWEQESGQMVIDKQKSWVALQLAWYLQKHYDIYFQFLNGDKDTFKYAWKAVNQPYHMVDIFLGMAGTMAGTRFCGHTMVQYSPRPVLKNMEGDYEDEVLFIHANLLKITDKNHFMRDGIEHPWDLLKYSSFSHANTWIKPEFWISGQGQACMDFTHREGEPDAVTQDFDQLLPDFQKNYFEYGGVGGETR